jgi:hypothetical protein
LVVKWDERKAVEMVETMENVMVVTMVGSLVEKKVVSLDR